MFGFVKPLVPELKVKDSDFYRSVYCGLCRSMSKHTGGISAFTLSYDMTFFALCRMALSDTELSFERIRCKAHPMKNELSAATMPNLNLRQERAVFSFITTVRTMSEMKKALNA